MSATVAAYRRLPSEKAMEQTIREAVEALHGRVWSVRDSRRLDVTDMPDLVLYVPASSGRSGMVGLIELKSQSRRVTAGQQKVVDDLVFCPVAISGVVRPEPKCEGEISMDDLLDVLGATR